MRIRSSLTTFQKTLYLLDCDTLKLFYDYWEALYYLIFAFVTNDDKQAAMVLLDAILKHYANAIVDLLLLHGRHDLVWLGRVTEKYNGWWIAKNVTTKNVLLRSSYYLFITNIYYTLLLMKAVC